MDDSSADAASDSAQQQANGLLADPSSSDPQQQAQSSHGAGGPADASARKPKGPSVRRACIACHAGKTRCSESLPCQSCVKRGIGTTCAYPDPDTDHHTGASSAAPGGTYNPPFPVGYAPPMTNLGQQAPYYEYAAFSGAAAGSTASATTGSPAATVATTSTNTNTIPGTSSFRPAKRPRPLTDQETAEITRNYTRGDFFIGSNAPVRIDPRLPVRLTLGENDAVHFTVGAAPALPFTTAPP